MPEPVSPLKQKSQRRLVVVDSATGEPEKRSALATFKRTKSFAAPNVMMREGSSKQPFQRIVAGGAGSSSARSLFGVPPPLERPLEDLLEEGGETSSLCEDKVAEGVRGDGHEKKKGLNRGLFSGLRFRVLGEAKTSTVKKAVEGAGGRMLSFSEDVQDDGDTDADFIIVRLVRYVSF